MFLKKNANYFIKLGLIAFLLHIIWENLQAPLYAGYVSFSQHFLLCLLGTVGDVITTFLVFVLLWMLKGEQVFSLDRLDFLSIAIMGFFIAVLIERVALLQNAWDYNLLMPVIPFLQVGLAPILQMTLLLPLTFFKAQKLTLKGEFKNL